MTDPQATPATPAPAAPGEDPAADATEKRGVARPLTAFAISLAFHAAILAVLAMVTWVVAYHVEPEVVLRLEDLQLGDGSGGPGGGGGGGGGSGDGTEGAPEAGAGNQAEAVANDAASGADAMPVPAPASIAAGAATIAAPAPQGATGASAAALDPALLAFGGAGTTSGTGGPGFGTGIGSGRGSGSGPGSGSGVGGGSGSGTGPGTGSGAGPGLGGVLDQMRTKGLDVVFVIDASDSMHPYIEQGKKRLREVVTVVTNLVAGAKVTEGVTGKSGIRFGLVAFKDYGDEYGIGATRSLPLTAEVAKLQKALDDVAAGGGGDIPEPLADALRAATSTTMGWSRQRENVIVMVTDAPCHSLTRAQAMQHARQFAKSLGGQVNVIDVGAYQIVTDDKGERRRTKVREGVLADLQGIAREGGGSAFLLEDEEAFWRHLIVSIFGQRFEQDIQQIIDTYVKQPAK